MPRYNNISLTTQDNNVMMELENLIGEPIPIIRPGSHGDHIKFDTFGFLVQNSFVKSLGIYGKSLKVFPKSVCNLGNLYYLSLSMLEFEEVPESIEKLVNVEKLYLSYNAISVLPETIGNLKELTILDLSNNCLEALPASIGHLTNLRRLHLNNNILTSLPESLGNLQLLEKLHLNNNKLRFLPELIKTLPNLKTLDAQENNFAEEWVKNKQSDLITCLEAKGCKVKI